MSHVTVLYITFIPELVEYWPNVKFAKMLTCSFQRAGVV